MDTQSLKRKIYAQSKIIEAFKKYDEERKQYYSKALIRLGKAESELEELKDSIDKGLQHKIDMQNQKIRSLEALIKINNIDWKDLDLNKAKEEILNLTNQLQKYTTENKKLREINAKLIYQLNNENNKNT